LPLGPARLEHEIRAISSGFVAELKRGYPTKIKYNFISGVNTLFNALLHTPGLLRGLQWRCAQRFAGAWPCKAVVRPFDKE